MTTPIQQLKNSLQVLGAALSCLLLMLSGVAQADTYQVNASVPYDPPTQPAAFDGGLDGTTVNNALLTVSGACQIQNPINVVSIWRGANSIGSAPCNSGTFSLQIMLEPGANTLTARTANASNLYGPDSAPITVTLVLSPDPTPEPPIVPVQNQTTEQVTETTNAGAASDLFTTTEQPFSVLTNNNDVTIQVTVGGGQRPYMIMLDWGDGSIESHSVDQPGSYTFTHAYVTAGTFMVRGSVQDVLGAMTRFSYAVISPTPTPASTVETMPMTKPAENALVSFIKHYWRLVAICLGALIVAYFGYVLGAHTRRKRRQVTAEQRWWLTVKRRRPEGKQKSGGRR